MASNVGASTGDLLDSLSDSLDDYQDMSEARETALASPRASTRLLQFLPLLGLALGTAMGAAPLKVLTGGGIGTLAGIVGLVLIGAGKLWTNFLLRRARGNLDVEGMIAVDVLAASLRAGLPIPAALAAAGEAWDGPTGKLLGRVGQGLATGQSWDQVWDAMDLTGVDAELVTGVRRALALAWDSGVQSSGLLAGMKARARRAARTEASAASARLGVWLMMPLGLCYLPAFLALGLVPVMVSLADSISITL
jgi:tight adherence protein B